MKKGNRKKFGLTALGLASICGAVFFVLANFDPDDVAREGIDRALGHLANSDLKLHQTSEVSVHPSFRIVVNDPVFATEEGNETAITSERLDARLKLAPMLTGRKEVSSLQFYRPHLTLDHDDLKSLFWSEMASKEINVEANPADIIVTDGTLDLSDNSSLSSLNLSVEHTDTPRGIAVSGDFVAGHHRTFVDLQIDDRRALFSGMGSAGKLSLSFDRLNSLAGNSLSDDADDKTLLAHLLRGFSALKLFVAGPLTIDGHFSLTPEAIRLSDTSFSKGGVSLEGDLILRRTTDTMILSGLHELSISADQAISGVIEKVSAGNWADAQITMPWLEGYEVDVDLEGYDIDLGRDAAFDTVRVSLRSRDANVSAEVAAESGLLGQLKARAEVKQAANVRMSVNVSDATIAHIMQPISRKMQKRLIGLPQLPEGKLDAKLKLMGRGQTLGTLFDSLSGSLVASMEDGSLTGADVVATLETLANGRQFMTKEKGPLIPAAGRTHFDRIDGEVGIEAGTARIARLIIAGERLEIDMLGDVGLKSGAVSVVGNAQLSAAQTKQPQQVSRHVDLPFGIGGTLFSPMIAAGVPHFDIAATSGSASKLD